MKKIIEVPQKCEGCGAFSPRNAPSEWGHKYGHRTPKGEPCPFEQTVINTVQSIRKRNRYTQERTIVSSNSFPADEVNELVKLFYKLESFSTDYTIRNYFLNNPSLRNVQGKFLRMQKKFE